MMDMDDDDEFGDLYTDVLRPFSAPDPPSAPNPTPPLSFTGGDPIPTKNPSPNNSVAALDPLGDGDPKDDWLPDNWNDDGDSNNIPKAEPPRVLAGEAKSRVSGSEGEGIRVSDMQKIEIGDLDEEPVIPGLSSAPAVPLSSNSDVRVSNDAAAAAGGDGDGWDSDSEDDLQIVLNDNSHAMMRGQMNGEDEDEDGEEDLVIVTDEDQQHHHHPPMEEQNWGEEEIQMAADGERKEGAEAGKANGAVASAVRIGYSSHGFHPQHHSMYKVRSC